MEPSDSSKAMSETKKKIAKKYSVPGESYDERRLVECKGELLSNFDRSLFLRLLPSVTPEEDVLEIGAGTGRFTLPVLKKGMSVTATDINTSLLEALQKKVTDAGVKDRCTIQQENVFELSFANDSFDLIYAIHVIPRFMTLEDQRDALEEISRVLKPGGKLLFNFRNRHSIYGTFHDDFAPTTAQINDILQQYNFKTEMRLGKWFVSRRAFDWLPLKGGHWLAEFDRHLHSIWQYYAWDIFTVEEKVF